MENSAESTLVLLARAGDQDAFGVLVRRRQSQIRGLLRQLSGDASLGDDLAQEALLTAWQKLAQLRDPARFGPWLRQVAVNTWLQHARRARLPIDALDDRTEPVAPDRDRPVERLTLEAALRQIREAERLCLVLAYQEGLSHPEVADATGFPVGTVKSHIARGTAKLRQWLGELPGSAGHD